MRRGGIPAAQGGSKRGAQQVRADFEPRMNTDGYAGFFTEGKEGKEGVTRRGDFSRTGWVYARSATGARRV